MKANEVIDEVRVVRRYVGVGSCFPLCRGRVVLAFTHARAHSDVHTDFLHPSRYTDNISHTSISVVILKFR